ncbi:MAG: glycerol-3-phosphate acyltransferase [Deinococcota bacterium]
MSNLGAQVGVLAVLEPQFLGVTPTQLIFYGLAYALSGYLLGALPLGGRLIKLMSGHDAKDVHVYTLGIENLYHFVGAPLAFASFTLDVIKGVLALSLVPLSGLTSASSAFTYSLAIMMLTVFVGHLYPLRILTHSRIPRGRGGGVLTGITLGLMLYGHLPVALGILPLVAYLVGLLASRYITVGVLAAFVSLPILLVVTTHDAHLAIAASFIALLAVWRQKASLTRIVNRVETQLGNPPAVHGRDPNSVYAAFMIHPITLDDMWQLRSYGWLGRLLARKLIPERLVRRSLLWWRPQKVADMRGITLADGRDLRVILIGAPMLPEQIRKYPAEALRMAVQGARLAREFGAESFGLGAYWSTVGNKGQQVQDAVPSIHVTNGGAYTAATVKEAVPKWLEQARNHSSTKDICAAVVGASGVVAFGAARQLAPHVKRLMLIGRDQTRVERSAATLRRRHPELELIATTDITMCQQAHLIVTATSSPVPVLHKHHVRAGCWIYDLGRPSDVAEDVYTVPDVQVIPGGVVRPPGTGELDCQLDIHFGQGYVPACLAETMIMTATKAYERKSLGPQTKTKDMAFYLEQGHKLGFELVLQAQPAPVPATFKNTPTTSGNTVQGDASHKTQSVNTSHSDSHPVEV